MKYPGGRATGGPRSLLAANRSTSGTGASQAAGPRGIERSLASRAWERWKVIAKKIGNFQSRLLLTLFYLLIVPFFAVIVKVFKDPLHLRPHKGRSYWRERTMPHPTQSTARRQF
jgi:hypothetical protein